MFQEMLAMSNNGGGGTSYEFNCYCIMPGSKTFTIDSSKTYEYWVSDTYAQGTAQYATYPAGNRALHFKIDKGVVTEFYNGNSVLTYAYSNGTLSITNSNANVPAVIAELILE